MSHPKEGCAAKLDAQEMIVSAPVLSIGFWESLSTSGFSDSAAEDPQEPLSPGTILKERPGQVVTGMVNSC